MIPLPWFRARGVSRGKPGSPGWQCRRLALLGVLVATSLLETGCQSGPFSPCGFIGRRTSFLTRPFRHGCDSCGGSEVVADGGCVSSGVPIGAAAAPIIVPGATVAPGAATPSNVLSPDSPQILDQAPQANPGPAPTRRFPSGPGSTGSNGSTGSTGSTGGIKTSTSAYETFRLDSRSMGSRGDDLARTLTTTPVPAARSAQDSSRMPARDTKAAPQGGANIESVLDHLPPLDLPSEVTEKTTTPPVAPPAQRKPQTQTPTSGPAPASDHLSGRSSRDAEADLVATAMQPPEPDPSGAGAPGISRFVAVDLRLAAGSVPSTAGLDWLSEKGYRTLVDLRESSETDLIFIAAVAKRGLRYITLPISLKTIDRAHVARFNLELAMGEARPLYFFDSDGTRAGVLWYIRRIAIDRLNNEIARREAANLGLNSAEYWSAARNYLERMDNLRSGSLDALGPVSMGGSQATAQSARPLSSEALAMSTAGAAAASANAHKAIETTGWRLDDHGAHGA